MRAGETAQSVRLRQVQRALGPHVTIVGLNTTSGAHVTLTAEEVTAFQESVRATVARLSS